MRFTNLDQLQETRYWIPAFEHEGMVHEGVDLDIRHAGVVEGEPDDGQFPFDASGRVEFGVALWPCALALADELVKRRALFQGTRVLELGAGVGLPGLVASFLGAEVVQTDASEQALALCRDNGHRNRGGNDALRRGCISYGVLDWSQGVGHPLLADAQFDWIIGSDILYSEALHPSLLAIFQRHLASGGSVLLADPLRPVSHRYLERLEQSMTDPPGFSVCLDRFKAFRESWASLGGDMALICSDATTIRGDVAPICVDNRALICSDMALGYGDMAMIYVEARLD